MARRVPDAPVTARPAPDSRVEKLGAHLAARPVVDDDLHLPLWAAQSMAQAKIEEMEDAKVLVLDPSSDELVERITDVLWMHVIFRDRNTGREAARAILAALSTATRDEQL